MGNTHFPAIHWWQKQHLDDPGVGTTMELLLAIG
jgi:hypothetical protein